MIVHPHAQPRPPVKNVISRAKRHVTLPHPKVEYGGLGRKKGCFTSIRTVLNRRLAPKWGRPKFGDAPYAPCSPPLPGNVVGAHVLERAALLYRAFGAFNRAILLLLLFL